MKAKEAPEKIYACFGVFGLIQATEIRATSRDIEYTRTDAFIDKAAKWLDETLRNTDFYENEIGLMIEDFKKAMKL